MARKVTTKEQLTALLGELGDSADAVADKLRATGVKGLRGRSNCCPVANWLVRETTADEAGVGVADIDVWGPEWGWLGAGTPAAVAEFVRFFDDGVYLDLVEEVTSGG